MKRNNSLNQKHSKPWNLFLWFLFACLILIVFYVSLERYFDQDEFEAIHTAWKITKGEKIYIDFFQHHHPFFYYLLAPVVKVMGEQTATLTALRIITFFLLLAILIATYYLASAIFNKKVGLISLLLLTSCSTFIAKAIEVRPDVIQGLFALLAILFLFLFFKYERKRSLILSSIFLAVSFLFLQKAVFLICFIGLILIIAAAKKQISWTRFFLYFLVFLIVIAPYFGYLVLTSSFPLYLSLNWILNSKFLNSFAPWDTLASLYQGSSLLSIFYVLGLILLFFVIKKTKGSERNPTKSSVFRGPQLIAVLSLALFAYIFLTPVPYAQYLLMALPLMAVVAAFALDYLGRVFRTNIFIGLLVLSVVFSAALSLQEIKKAHLEQERQLNIVDYVLIKADQDDFVYDGDITFNLFRRDIDYFWFSTKPDHGLATYSRAIKSYHYDIYESIEKYKPQIISIKQISNLEDERVADYYKSSVYHDLYIRTD